MDQPKTKWNSLLIQHQYNSTRGFNSRSDYEKFMFTKILMFDVKIGRTVRRFDQHLKCIFVHKMTVNQFTALK